MQIDLCDVVRREMLRKSHGGQDSDVVLVFGQEDMLVLVEKSPAFVDPASLDESEKAVHKQGP